MTDWLEALGHLVTGVAFTALIVYVRNNQIDLRRTTRHAHLMYDVILGVALFGCVANLVWLAYYVLDLDMNTSFGSWLSIVTHVSILSLVFVIASLIRFKPTAILATGKSRHILAIGAHPDDIEIACGGTLARLRDEGHIVHGLILTHGAQGGNALVRQTEAQNGALILGLHELTLLDLSDTRLADEKEIVRQRIEEKVQSFQPDVILTHSANDQHQDHQVIHYATMQAGRRVNTILCYESPSVTPNFMPHLFIEISGYLDVKIESIREHVDQSGKPYMDEEHVRAQARVRGEQARTQYAEGFEIRRALMMEGGML